MLNNRKVVLAARAMMLLLLFTISIDLIFSGLSGSLSDLFYGHYPAIVSGVILFIIAILNPRFFSFSDDHEMIHIRSRSAFWTVFENQAEIYNDIPKAYISAYELIRGGMHPKLVIILNTAYRGEMEYSFSMSFFRKVQFEQIEASLDKVINRNNLKTSPDLANVG